MNPPLLLLATHNRGKLREVAAILSDLPIQVGTLEKYPGIVDAVEDADTFEGNARKKALHYARLTGEWTLADDSGLEVEALGRAPGVLSARYAQSERGAEATRLEEATRQQGNEAGRAVSGRGAAGARLNVGRDQDAANNAKLIAALRGVPPERRTARFHCVVALAKPGAVLAVAHGSFEGRIIDDARGANGFGYDPHFWSLEHGMTSAEMPPALKNSISHRAKALAAIRPRIVELLRLETG